MEIGSLGFRTDVMLLRWGGSEVRDVGEYVVVRTPANPGFWWGNFLLFRRAFASRDVEKRMELFRAEFPEAEHVAFGIDSTDGVVGAEDELTAAEFDVERNVVMTAGAVVSPRRPNRESAYRLVTSDDDWAQVVQVGLATAAMEVDAAYEEFTRRQVSSQRALVEAGHGKWFGAFDGHRLQGSLGLMFDGNGVARCQNVQTHPEHQGRGIASTLVHRASTYGLTEGGAHTLVMVADPEYLAIRIYRSLGFSATETQLQVTRRPS